jgi:CheY-like chemotaxis protein
MFEAFRIHVRRWCAMSDRTPHIVLLEEEPVLAEITAFRLELLGYRVTCVHTGEDLLKQLIDQTPDLIIVDTYLPDMNGLELINRITSDSRYGHIPVMVFSVEADLEGVQKAVAAGAKDFLVTPYDPAVLENKVELLLQETVAKR